MKYRITIESEYAEDGGRSSWRDEYQQVIDDLNVSELVAIINRPVGSRRYPTAEEFWNYIEKTV